MRKFFMWFGIGAAVLIAGLVAILVYVAVQGSALDGESRVYAAESVDAIISSWKPDELIRRATPQLRASAKPSDVEGLFSALAIGLGKVIETDVPVGGSLVSVTSAQGKVISANYTMKARFEKGDAVIRIALLKVDEQWRVHGFNVDSAAAFTNLSGRPS